MDPARRHVRAFGDPRIISLEAQAELVVEHAQIAIAAAHHGVRHDRLHLLRDHADITRVAADVAEAIEAEPVGEMAEQHDVVLERDVGAPATTAAADSTATADAGAA